MVLIMSTKLYGNDYELRIGESTRYQINKDRCEDLMKKLEKE